MPAGLPARASPSLSPPTAKLRHPLPWWYAGAASRPAAWHAFHLSAACTAGGRPKRGGRAPWLGSVSVKPMSSSTTPGSSGSFTCGEGHAISSLSAPLAVCCACSAAHLGPSAATRLLGAWCSAAHAVRCCQGCPAPGRDRQAAGSRPHIVVQLASASQAASVLPAAALLQAVGRAGRAHQLPVAGHHLCSGELRHGAL